MEVRVDDIRAKSTEPPYRFVIHYSRHERSIFSSFTLPSLPPLRELPTQEAILLETAP